MIDAMIGIRAEPRTALIAVVEISLEGPAGAQLSSSARMEDRSPSGACIRVKAPIPVGTKVKVSGRWERFSGVTKYCRRDGWEYLVGIQRQSTDEIRMAGPLRMAQQRDTEPRNDRPHLETAVESAAKKEPDSTLNEIQTARVEIGIVPIASAIRPAAAARQAAIIDEKLESPDQPRILQDAPFEASLEASRNKEIQTPQPSPGKELGKERTDMSTKWLDTAFKRQKQDAANGKSNGAHAPEHRAPVEAAVKASVRSDEGLNGRPRPQGDLPPMEDIYRAAGIMNPRMGYSITKVAEMINSITCVGYRTTRNERRSHGARCRRDFDDKVLRDGARRARTLWMPMSGLDRRFR